MSRSKRTMVDTTVSENEAVQKLNNAYPKVSTNYKSLSRNQSQFELKNFNYLDTNGDLVHSDCDVLPNNNVCTNMELSHCYVDGDCSSSVQKREMAFSSRSNSPFGESSSRAPSQECDTHSVHPADTTATGEFLLESQSGQINCYSNLEERHLDDSTGEELLVESNSLDLNNGAIKKANHKLGKSPNNRKKLSTGTSRGRPRKALVAMYHSQISGDKNTIKIRIKKSNLTAQVQLPPNKKKSGRRKRHKINSDTDTSDTESRRKRSRTNIEAESDVSSTQESVEQSQWANLPHNILYRIFQTLCAQEGCLPLLVRLCRVCRQWRNVALSPLLWRTIDLNWVRERLRTDLKLHWLIQNRLMSCQDLNLGEWKVRDIQLALEALSEHCPELRGLTLSGWKGLNADHLKYLTTEFGKLERLDLSSINVSGSRVNTSAINAQPLVGLAQSMNSRLTHLVLAHNKLAGFTQIVAAIGANCPNLQLLDISNIRTVAHNTALLHIEKLQSGCPKLRVLRITNSQVWLAPIRLLNQVASPGFPMLEELSLAGVEDDQITARSIDDDGIERILKNSNKLRLLDVRGCLRLTDSGLVRVPAWDLEHLFLSSCYVTRIQNSGLELILQKWSHSLLEVDLAWSTATSSLDAAVLVLAEKGADSPLRVLNLCGSSVSLDPVKAVLTKCPKLHSINLQSCRALPRGIKRLYTGEAVAELRQSLQDKPKTESGEMDAEQTSSEKLSSI